MQLLSDYGTTDMDVGAPISALAQMGLQRDFKFKIRAMHLSPLGLNVIQPIGLRWLTNHMM